MGDSDDEYDRKRRDKFRGERSAGDNYRSDRRDDRRGGGGGRDDWGDRNPFRGRSRPDYGEYRGGGGGGRGGRDRYSPGRDLPPPKRMRPDWGDEGRGRYGGHEGYPMYAWGHEPYPMHPGHGGFGSGGPQQMNNHNRGETATNPDMQTQPPMLTLKQFLDTQDDTISDSEVLRKYSDYKLDFKRQQLNEFFVAHKDEEWFKSKYHPEESLKRKEEQFGFLKRRVDVFAELLDKGQITNVSVDTNQTDALLRLLDTVVIKLEGGNEDDLKALDEKPPPMPEFSSSFQSKFDSKRNVNDKDDDDVVITSVQPIAKRLDDFNEADWAPVSTKASSKAKNDDDGDNWDSVDTNPTKKSGKSKDDDDNWDCSDSPQKKKSADDNEWDTIDNNVSKKASTSDDDDWGSVDKSKNSRGKAVEDGDDWDTFEAPSHSVANKAKDESDNEEEPVASTSKGRKRSKSRSRSRSSSLSSSSSSSASSRGGDDDHAGRKSPEAAKNESVVTNTNDTVENVEIKKEEENIKVDKSPEKPAEGSNLIDDDQSETVVAKENGKSEKEEISTEEQKMETEDDKAKTAEEKTEEPENKVEEDKTETIDLDKEKDPEPEVPKSRALHRTSSIFLRNLAPTITKAEIEAVCKRYDGFLRVAIADPLVERRWFRRGWVTFKRDVNIKEICWNLNNIRLRDCEMGAIVNRDLSRRVRPVNGITAHKSIVRSDIKLCAKIVLNLDEKFNLWLEALLKEGNGTNGESSSFGFKSNNPVLQNITDFLIEEASAEEDELLGLTGSENKDSADGEMLDRDPQILSVLDKLILYLRIVHSVDFYNHCEYPYEDEMPNRCGIIHARGPAPQNKITNNDIQDYIKNFEGKMTSFLAKSAKIEEDELKNLGIKDSEAEVEKFIQANTQELAKDKWLCPLSGKKFKGPEFIRKHIFNKHVEKVDEVRKEVEYFNNYLRDPKRPQLPEHPGNTRRQPAEAMTQPMPYRPGYGAPAYAPPYAAYAPPMVAQPRPRGFGVGGGRRDMGKDPQRRVIGYHDLDAPQNFDMFD